MLIHLDPVGGVAGDMFAAAMLDAFPDLEAGLRDALRRAGLDALVRMARVDHRDHALTGSLVSVEPIETVPAKPAHDHGHGHGHRDYAEIRAMLDRADLDSPVRDRAQAMFRAIAHAEGRVHGIEADRVTFHEVGAWDSIADIVMAAWLIEHCGASAWSATPLPLGRGRVETAHGRLPVPAPATALLLEGIPMYQDEHLGERVTPTGAAIVAHLRPTFGPVGGAHTLSRSGTGFGTRVFPGMSNVLRLLVFDTPPGRPAIETVAVCEFEVDDQTGEDLAVALDRLRECEGVLDVVQAPAFGKKGRLASSVRVLAAPSTLDATVERCLVETTTLGVRWHLASRRALDREQVAANAAGAPVRVKRTRRPDGEMTTKAEMDDLAGTPGGHAGRQQLRRQAENREC